MKWLNLSFGSAVWYFVETGGRDETEARQGDGFEGSSKCTAQKQQGAVNGVALALDGSGSQSAYAMCPLNFSFPLSKMRIKIVLPYKDVVRIK